MRVADLFCGAGGTSSGAKRAMEARGRSLSLTAVNHWDVAIETHARNHPEAEHHCSNLYRLAPRAAVPRGRLDLLMASPTCTYHSRARGGRPISRQQRYGRMTPTQVVRWADELRAKTLLVENVPEFMDWGPVHGEQRPLQARCVRARCRPEKPCKARKGTYFRAWVRKLERLGFRLEWRVLNCADYGDATTRRRFFLLGRRDGRRILWPAPTHSADGQPDLFGAGGVRWRGAREVIDWGLPGRSIFTRTKPLSPKTMARIYAGAVRFGWPEPFLVVLRQHMAERGLDLPLPALTAGGAHVGLVQPLVARTDMHKSNALCVRRGSEPLPTITTAGGLGVVQPFVLGQQSGGAPRSTRRPVPTIATDGAHALIAAYYGQGGCTGADDPLPTVTTRDRFGLVLPVTHAGPRRVANLEAPLPTVTGAHRGELAFVVPAFGERRGRLNLVEPGDCVDVLFRMFQPPELARATGFAEGYDFAGNKGEVTAQIGNAVPVYTATALVAAIVDAGAA